MSRIGWAFLLIFLAELAGVPAAAGRDAQEAGWRLPGTVAPALARLFTPRHAPDGAYEVTVLEGGIEDARRALWGASGHHGAIPRGTWPVRRLDPLDAFGEAGTYHKTTVARLYTGRRAQVVRAPIERDGRPVAAITLISPYPDPTLSRLEEGTLVIVLHLVR